MEDKITQGIIHFFVPILVMCSLFCVFWGSESKIEIVNENFVVLLLGYYVIGFLFGCFSVMKDKKEDNEKKENDKTN